MFRPLKPARQICENAAENAAICDATYANFVLSGSSANWESVAICERALICGSAAICESTAIFGSFSIGANAAIDGKMAIFENVGIDANIVIRHRENILIVRFLLHDVMIYQYAQIH